MDENQFRVLMQILDRMHEDFRRMAQAAEDQVAETKAMREMVERQREERQ